MNREQRKAKRRRGQYHGLQQSKRKERAIVQAIEAATKLGKNGQPLKRERSNQDDIARIMREKMEEQGYVPNGRGGWRRLAKTTERSIDKA